MPRTRSQAAHGWCALPERLRDTTLRAGRDTWKAGVDVLCFGGTKNGMAVGEAVVFFDRDLAEDFEYRCKQAGQLASKMRFLSAPWIALLKSGAWLRNARHANECATRLANQVMNLPGIGLLFPVQANAVFLTAPQEVLHELRSRGWRFYTFIGGGARFMFAWDAEPERVDTLAADLREACLFAQHEGAVGAWRIS